MDAPTNRSPAYAAPEPQPADESETGRRDRVSPAELRIAVMRSRQHEQPRLRLGRCAREVGRRPPQLLQLSRRPRGLDRLELADPGDRTDGLDPPRVEPGVDPLDFVEGVVAVDLNPQVLRERIEGHAEAVAEAVREHLAQVRGDFAPHPLGGPPERIVPRRRSVVVQPQHDAAQMRVVRGGAAELIVRRGRGRALARGSAASRGGPESPMTT